MTEKQIVRVKSAPGLHWKKREGGKFEARWQCRDDLVKRLDFDKFKVKSVKLWTGAGDPTLEEWDFIADTCAQLQQEMLVWARGGLPDVAPELVQFESTTLANLIATYRTDPDSNYKKRKNGLRYASRVHYDVMMGMIEKEYGDQLLSEIKGRTLQHWYDGWTEDGRIATGHAKIKMLRILFNFGSSMLEDANCIRIASALSKMKFAATKPRKERLTAAQAVAVRAKAWELGRPSIALCQAFQFELMLRQKDCIGEWVPMRELELSDVLDGTGLKWLRGIRWEEINENMVLTHVTSKRQKEIAINLLNAPMVIEELSLFAKVTPATLTRDKLPPSGPIIVSEFDGLPWEAIEFRRWWRKVADACGIPKTVRNMDSRAGAISEATDAGAPVEHVRHAATHSDINMTIRYSRGTEEKIASVQKLRAESRNKPRTE